MFKEPEAPPAEEPPAEDPPAEGEPAAPAEPKEEPEKFPTHVYIPEVVREPKMHFFKVPRLGSYMAINLTFDSCLNEAAFDKAYEDHNQLAEQREE